MKGIRRISSVAAHDYKDRIFKLVGIFRTLHGSVGKYINVRIGVNSQQIGAFKFVTICVFRTHPSFLRLRFLFYGPSTHFRSFRARSVTLTTLFLGKPPRQFTSTYYTFFNQWKRENGGRNVFMTKSPRKNVPDVMRKPVYALCEQQRRKSVCASAQTYQHLCFLLPGWFITSSCYNRYSRKLSKHVIPGLHSSTDRLWVQYLGDYKQ